MKKLTKKILSLMLALIMAMPVMFALPEAASADMGINSHLRAHYFLDNNFARDNVGSYNLEQVNGGTYYWSNGGVAFPGSNNSYFRVPLNDMLSNVNFNNGFTIVFTARRNSNGWHRYLELSSNSGYGSGDSTEYFFFATNGNAKINHPAANNNNKYETSSPNVGEDGGWHTWAVTFKNGSFRVYRDGEDRGAIEDSNRVNTDWFNRVKNGWLLLGASSFSGDANFNGWLKNIKIYDVPLTAAQISDSNSDELFQWTFDSTLNERFTGSSCAASVMQSWGGNYSNEGDHIYCKDSWLMASVPSRMRDDRYKRNWRMDFDINPTQDFGANRLELMPGITDQTGLDSNYNGGQSFGMSTNGKIYFRTTDFDNGAWGDTGLNLKQWYADHGKQRVTITYAYHDGTICVLIDWNLVFSRNVSEYKSFFENINTVTFPGRNGAGVYMDLWDFSCYSFQEKGTVNDHMKGRYFLGDIEQNFVSDNYDFNVSGTGASWSSSDDIEAAHFNGGNSGNSPNYLYMPKSRTKAMFKSASFNTGFTFSFMSKSIHTDSWQRVFELTNVDSAYGGGSGNRYVMFTSQYDGSAHLSTTTSDSLTLNVLGGVGSWHVWTVTVKEGAIHIYRDGGLLREEHNINITNAWFDDILTNGQILLGASTFSDAGFDGYIRDLRIYDIALNASQVSDVYTDTYNNRTYFDGIPDNERQTYINNLSNAMRAYESKLDSIGSDFLTNTKAAYDAYVTANRYYDALVYGKSQKITVNTVNRVVSNLNAKKDAMGSWSYKNATNHGRFSADADYVSDDNYRETYNKVIWASEVNNNSDDSTVWGEEIDIYGGNEKCNPRLFHPVAVLMYDGQSQPYLPVFSYFRHWCKGGVNYKYNWYYSSAYISDNANGLIIANTKWRNGSSGSDESFNYQWNYLKDGGKEVNVYNYYTTDDYQHWSKGFWGSTDWNLAYANQLKFTGSLGSSEYLRTITPTWGFVFWNQTSNRKNPTYAGSKSIYVINYKAIRDALSAAKTTCANVENYKEGGLATFFQGCDEATSINPDGYGWSKDNVATKANDLKNDISNAIGHINTINDNSLYPQLRTEMMGAHNNHPTGNTAEYDYTHYWDIYNDYTPNSMNTFYDAYFNAEWHMAALANNNYYWESSADNNRRLSELVNAHAGLKRRASFSALDTAYTNAKTAQSGINSGLYTTSSVSTYNTFLNTAANFPYHSRNENDRANTPADPDQSSIDSEAGTLTNAQSKLELRADFSALDAAKKVWTDYLTNHSAEYTTSSKTALSNYINSTSEFVLENTADRADTGVSQNSAIASEVTKYGNIDANDYLDPVANLSKLQSAYDKGDALLESLVGKTAQYDGDSVQALINAVSSSAVSDYLDAEPEEKANFGTKGDISTSDQLKANKLADNIDEAIAGLKISEVIDEDTGEAVDTSVFDSLVNTINNLDPDAYEENAGGSLAAAQRFVNENYGTAVKVYDGQNINVVNGITTQEEADLMASKIQDALTVCIKKYVIIKNAGVSDVAVNNGKEEGGMVNYGATLTCKSKKANGSLDSDTAWFLEIQTGSMHKKLAFQSYGATLKTKVLGITTVNAIKRDETNNCRVMITRSYGADDDREPVQYVNFVPSGTEFTLPASPAIAYSSFSGYSYKDGDAIAVNGEGDYVITVNGDVEIVANYTESAAACAINATDIAEVEHNSTVKYNEKVELDGGEGTYGWIEEIGDTYRPFYKGQKVSFLATESTTLIAVNETNFRKYGATPCVNLRKSGVEVTDTETGKKYTFNAQLVPGTADVREYGILVAAPSSKNGYTPITPADTQIIIENSGQQAGYAILRAKSTKLVGANQFTIAINNLPAGYKYRGYVIYSDGTSLQTAYSDVM